MLLREISLGYDVAYRKSFRAYDDQVLQLQGLQNSCLLYTSPSPRDS